MHSAAGITNYNCRSFIQLAVIRYYLYTRRAKILLILLSKWNRYTSKSPNLIIGSRIARSGRLIDVSLYNAVYKNTMGKFLSSSGSFEYPLLVLYCENRIYMRH